ncbi:hypothetical protein YC2023_061261 [Brassica napus]
MDRSMDICTKTHRSIEYIRCSSKFPRNIPRLFRGNRVWGNNVIDREQNLVCFFINGSINRNNVIDRLDYPIDGSNKISGAFFKRIDRSVFVQKRIDRCVCGKQNYKAKPELFGSKPQNSHPLRLNHADRPRKFRRNSDANG